MVVSPQCLLVAFFTDTRQNVLNLQDFPSGGNLGGSRAFQTSCFLQKNLQNWQFSGKQRFPNFAQRAIFQRNHQKIKKLTIFGVQNFVLRAIFDMADFGLVRA
jgi:hypothetical protein